MYAYIKGKVIECHPTQAVLEAGGVGYQIHITLPTFSYLEGKQEALLYVYHIQREDMQALYGFHNSEEKEIFGHLLSVSGVGPNTARVILSSLSTAEVKAAIGGNEVSTFKRVKGVGPKTAQRIIIDLKDKMELSTVNVATSSTSLGNTAFNEALSALIALGFPRTKASSALAKINVEQPGGVSVENLIKQALSVLS